MSAEQRAWQRSRPAGGARNTQQSRSSTASPNPQNNNTPAKAAASPAAPSNVWAEKAQERSRSAAQRATGSTRDGSSGTKDGGRKAGGGGDGAGASASAGASPQVAAQQHQPQQSVPRAGLSTKELLNFLKQGSSGAPSYKMAVPEDAKAGGSDIKSRNSTLMANGQDFFVELGKQSAALKAKNKNQ